MPTPDPMLGKLQASIRTTSDTTGSGRCVVLHLEDPSSKTKFLEVTLDFAAFGRLVSCSGEVLCHFELHDPERVGKIRQEKFVTISMPAGEKWRDLLCNALPPFEKAIAPHEVDGWKASRYVSGQAPYNMAGDTREYEARLVRFVDPPA